MPATLVRCVLAQQGTRHAAKGRAEQAGLAVQAACLGVRSRVWAVTLGDAAIRPRSVSATGIETANTLARRGQSTMTAAKTRGERVCGHMTVIFPLLVLASALLLVIAGATKTVNGGAETTRMITDGGGAPRTPRTTDMTSADHADTIPTTTETSAAHRSGTTRTTRDERAGVSETRPVTARTRAGGGKITTTTTMPTDDAEGETKNVPAAAVLRHHHLLHLEGHRPHLASPKLHQSREWTSTSSPTMTRVWTLVPSPRKDLWSTWDGTTCWPCSRSAVRR